MPFVPDSPQQSAGRFVPDQPQSLETPVNAGIANFGAGVLAIPGEAMKAVTNLGIAGYGVGKRLLTGSSDLPAPIQSFPGDYGDWLAKFKATGMNALNPENPTPNDLLGTKAYQFTSRGGFIPGMALPAAGSMAAESLGGPEWAGVGALLPSAGVAAYNAARAPSLAAAQQRNMLRDQALAEGRAAGYKVPPSQTGAGPLENVTESLAGKAAIKQQATLDNQLTTNSLARQALGIPENTPISQGLLGNLRNRLAEPYRQIANLSPMAADILEKLRTARADSTAWYRYYDHTPHPAALKRAKGFEQRAAGYETALEKIAQSKGQRQLVPQMREARKALAQTYDIERALNYANGEVHANIIGRMFDQGKPLSGPLKTIGKFAQATEGKFTGAASGTPSPGVGNLNIYGSVGMGMGGGYMYGREGAAAGLLPWLGTPVRAGLLSDLYQKTLASPSYAPAVSNTPPIEQMLQLEALRSQQGGNQ